MENEEVEYVHELSYTGDELTWCDKSLRLGIAYDLDNDISLSMIQKDRTLTLAIKGPNDLVIYNKELDISEGLVSSEFEEFSKACKAASELYAESVDFMIDRGLKALKSHVIRRLED